MPNKPRCRQSINVSPGKKSYILIADKGKPFPDVYDPAHPRLGTILYFTVTDDDNGFAFNPTVVPQTDKSRLALLLVSQLPGGGTDPMDGLLTVTMNLVSSTATIPPPTNSVPVSDVPVDYISDPAGP